MLLSLVVQLTARSDAALTGDTGRAAQALFLRWVQERDPSLTTSLHDSSEARPYTASALRETLRFAQGDKAEGSDAQGNKMGGSRTGERHHDRPTAVQAGHAYWLRFTTLTEPLSRLLLDVAQDLPDHVIELSGAAFTVQGVASEPSAHSWAAHSSYGDLAQAHFLNVHNPPRRVTLDFASPTAFHHTVAPSPPSTVNRQPSTINYQPSTPQGRQVTIPLPLPELVFGSLLMRWNAFAPIALPEEVRRYAQDCLAVSRYRLQTHMLRFGQAMSVGFVGQCQYTVLEWDAYWLRAIHLLAAYAFYSGVGLRTAVGMGQVRVRQYHECPTGH